MTSNSDTETLRAQIEDNPALSLEPSDPDDRRHYDRAWRHWDVLVRDGRLGQVDLINLAALLDAVYERGAAAALLDAES